MNVREPGEKSLLRRGFGIILSFLPILLAVVTVLFLLNNRPGLEKKPEEELSRTLRIVHALKVTASPRVRGYGLVEPRQRWQAVAEVRGSLVFVHPHLEAGVFVEKEELLLQIDPAEYELVVARLKAAIGENHAKLRELKVEEESTRASLKIERQSLELAQKSAERLRTLQKKDVIPSDQLDREERSILQQKQAIQQLENLLALFPARTGALNAALQVNEAHLKQALRDLDKTLIRAPFEGRLGKVDLEEGQVLRGGETLFEMHGTQAVEIEARFHPAQLRSLVPPEKRDVLESGIPLSGLSELLQVTATVRLRHGSWESSWPAEFYGLRESVDPRTQAMNVVVTVEDPYGKGIPGVRPALMQGMYCEVELCGSPRHEALIIPRSALWGSRVYVLDEEDRLQILPVQVAFAQEDFVVLTSGVEEGRRIIVSDPSPAIEGMKVDPLWDEALQEKILEQAKGERISR
ncbi:MAG TPA: hypothetical protein PK364_03145 [Synergistaceae bacterium]|nr:hypothetical protein [Synergistaceae bacterium]HPJ26232.1 hypothetical protein [Synergistaceae bacterium]HPQ36611.1 hypothetical protein [Synergistaceae bacterium]